MSELSRPASDYMGLPRERIRVPDNWPEQNLSNYTTKVAGWLSRSDKETLERIRKASPLDTLLCIDPDIGLVRVGLLPFAGAVTQDEVNNAMKLA